MDAQQLFLLRHAQIHGERTVRHLDRLTEEQIRARPHPAVNSIAWLFWHVARSEDLGVNRFVGDRTQVLDDEEWMPRLDVFRRDIGQGMTFPEVEGLSTQVNLDALLSYWDAVGRRTVAVVSALTADNLDETVDAAHTRRVVFDEGGVKGADQEAAVGLWSNMSRGYALVYLGLTHTFGHFGELDVIRGLWGYRTRF